MTRLERMTFSLDNDMTSVTAWSNGRVLLWFQCWQAAGSSGFFSDLHGLKADLI